MRLGARLRRFLFPDSLDRSSVRDPGLREFVYLDDVSVYSLTASLSGAIPTQFTEESTRRLATEMDSDFEAGFGIAKGRLGGRASASRESASQVVRKAIVQSGFKDLYERAEDLLLLRPPTGEIPKVANAAALPGLVGTGWVVLPESLARGSLIDVDVALDADQVFRVSAIASAALELLHKDMEAFGVRLPAETRQVAAAHRLLDRMLTGLVPVRGTAIDWKVVPVVGQELIVHRSLTEQIESELVEMSPLIIVGDAEQRLFWKDIRRVLFSGSAYRIYARVTVDGIQNEWSPVKLFTVLRQVAPGLDTKFIEAIEHLPLGVAADVSGGTVSNREGATLSQAAEAFLLALAEQEHVAISDQAMIELSGAVDFRRPYARYRRWEARILRRTPAGI